ncbi:MAG: YXWGXW repeat-containing protein [Casimicrobiaceae bacterium]
MHRRSIISALTLSLGALGIATIAHARVLDVEIGVAPPPARVEVAPPQREGYIYEPGHYESTDGRAYTWTEGRYIHNREGHEWRPYVMERHGDRWHFRPGHWDDDD